MKLRLRALIVIAHFVLCGAQAGLTWTYTEIDRLVSPDATELVVTYPFTNATDQTITITALKTACSCTVADLADREIEPGASDAITVRLELTPTGERRKTIFVYTDDGATTMLHLAARKSGYLIVEAPDLVWRTDAPAEVRIVTVRLAKDSPITPPAVTVIADDAKVAATLTAESGDSTWRLRLQPRDTSIQGRYTVVLDTGIGDAYGGIFRFELWVLPQPEAAPAD
jgi:hypothetical protein